MTKKEKEILMLSNKLLNMGMGLIAQGTEKKNGTIVNAGSFMLMISGIIVNQEDMNEFGKVCEEFALNKINQHDGEYEKLELTLEEHFNIIQSRYDELGDYDTNNDGEYDNEKLDK
jgi:hypothetical protein